MLGSPEASFSFLWRKSESETREPFSEASFWESSFETLKLVPTRKKKWKKNKLNKGEKDMENETRKILWYVLRIGRWSGKWRNDRALPNYSERSLFRFHFSTLFFFFHFWFYFAFRKGFFSRFKVREKISSVSPCCLSNFQFSAKNFKTMSWLWVGLICGSYHDGPNDDVDLWAL